jgi:mannose-6-phosphate isomerase-like protein (cupin superfamily)
MMNPENGSKNALIYRAQNAVGGGGPNLHFHTFDQFFFVIEGELTVQIGLEKYHVKPHTLVILPAGVPHTQWNEGTKPEQHFAVLTPPFSRSDVDRPDVYVKYKRLEGVD